MTSIAITTITTAIPMLMTTSKPARPRRRAAGSADTPGDDTAPSPGGRSGMQDDEAAALYRLMTWLSPAFPVGAFSYSSGIEWAVEAGDIVDAASLRDWLARCWRMDPGFCDGVLLAHTHRAASSLDAADCATSRNLRRPSCPRASASSKPRRRDAPSSTSPAPHGIATGSIG
jgi:urease accessory protein